MLGRLLIVYVLADYFMAGLLTVTGLKVGWHIIAQCGFAHSLTVRVPLMIGMVVRFFVT